MQSYYVYAAGELCRERSDELARAYRQAQPSPYDQREARRRSLRRLMDRMRDARRALASEA